MACEYEAKFYELNNLVSINGLDLVFPLSLSAKSDQNSIEKFKANLKEVEEKKAKSVTLVFTDFLQIDNLKCEFSEEESEKELMRKAFGTGLKLLKEYSAEIIKLTIPFKIEPWHNIMYKNFDKTTIMLNQIFFENKNDSELLKKLDEWARGVTDIFLKENLVEKEDYIKYFKKIESLCEDDNHIEFKGKVTSSSKRFKDKVNKNNKKLLLKNAQEIEKKNEELCENYVKKESAVYWMWNDEEKFNASVYPANLNPAMEYLAEKMFKDENHKKYLGHFKIKFHQKKMDYKKRTASGSSFGIFSKKHEVESLKKPKESFNLESQNISKIVELGLSGIEAYAGGNKQKQEQAQFTFYKALFTTFSHGNQATISQTINNDNNSPNYMDI